MSRIGVFLADGMEEIEALTVVDLLRRAGITVDMISITDDLPVEGAHQITVLADKIFAEVDFNELDGIVLPGGTPGTTNLKKHPGVQEQAAAFVSMGKLVGAICAAPTLLGAAGLLRGKQAVCYPGMEEELLGAKVLDHKVVRDGTIITSRSLGTAIPFALELCAYLLGAEKAKEIKESIVYGHIKIGESR